MRISKTILIFATCYLLLATCLMGCGKETAEVKKTNIPVEVTRVQKKELQEN